MPKTISVFKIDATLFLGEDKECYLCLDVTFTLPISLQNGLISVTWSPLMAPAYEKEGKEIHTFQLQAIYLKVIKTAIQEPDTHAELLH